MVVASNLPENNRAMNNRIIFCRTFQHTQSDYLTNPACLLYIYHPPPCSQVSDPSARSRPLCFVLFDKLQIQNTSKLPSTNVRQRNRRKTQATSPRIFHQFKPLKSFVAATLRKASTKHRQDKPNTAKVPTEDKQRIPNPLWISSCSGKNNFLKNEKPTAETKFTESLAAFSQ